MPSVAHVMRKDLKSVPSTTTIRAIAKRMRDERIGALLVEKAGALVGIVTDTDVVRRGIAEENDINRLTAENIMTSPIVTIESVRTVQDAHDMMGDLHVRHLGVSEGGKLVGLVSVRDLLVYFKRVSEPKITQD